MTPIPRSRPPTTELRAGLGVREVSATVTQVTPQRLWILLVALLAGGLTGCMSGSQGSARPRYLIVGKAQAQYWEEVRLGAERMAKELGVDVSVYLPPHEDPEGQARAVEEAAQEGAAGIAFAASEPDAIALAAKTAEDRDVPLITLDTDAPGTPRLAYIGTDNLQAGRRAGEAMVRLTGGKGRVIISTGSLTAYNARERIEGFEAVLSKHPEMEVVEIVANQENPVTAQQRVIQVLRKRPQVVGIFAVYGIDGPAVAKAVRAVGREGAVKIVGFDTTPEQVKLLREGVIHALVGQRPFTMGSESVRLLEAVKRVGPRKALAALGPSRFLDTGVDLVTADNLSEYKRKLKALGIPNDQL